MLRLTWILHTLSKNYQDSEGLFDTTNSEKSNRCDDFDHVQIEYHKFNKVLL